LYANNEIKNIKGIGAGVYEIIDQVMKSKKIAALEKLEKETPSGLIDILNLPGIGPKKARLLWKELGVTTIGELEYACQENRLSLLDGFGAKTQDNILKAIVKHKQEDGLFRLDEGYQTALTLIHQLEKIKNVKEAKIDGELLGGAETLKAIEIAISTSNKASELKSDLKNVLQNIKIDDAQQIIFAEYDNFPVQLNLISQIKSKASSKLITRKDLLGAFHNHTHASDGTNSIEEMRQAAIERGLTYLGISDHSQSAFYANGLKAQELLEQCQVIETLNQEQLGKKCFLLTGVESDILKDGELDYENEVLNKLDVVIASVHSRLKQDAEQMTLRMINAARNPWTMIVGHPTGRLILGREPSQYDMEAFLKACKENNTIVELNSHPHRLDLNAKHLAMAKEMGVLIAINADAHATNGLDDLEYGIMTARRAGLKAEDVFNCLPLKDVLHWIKKRKERAIRLS